MPALPRIRREEIDGIPVVWGDDATPFTAGLVFRVGRSDETLATGGITHLVEHLALPARRLRRVQFNGTVECVLTSFWASGPRERVLDVLRETARTLSDLPLDRLEIERATLLTEAAGAGSDPVRRSVMLRFGALGYGQIGYEEYGLRDVGPADVEAWAATRFTHSNASPWMTARAAALLVRAELRRSLVPRAADPRPRTRRHLGRRA